MADPDMRKVYRRERKLSKQDFEAIPILHSQGWSIGDIASLLGVHIEHIRNILKGKCKCQL